MPEQSEHERIRIGGIGVSRSSQGVFPHRSARPPRPPRERPKLSINNLPRIPLAVIAILVVLALAAFGGWSVYQAQNCTYFGENRTQLISPDGMLTLNIGATDLRGSFGAQITAQTFDETTADRVMNEAISNVGKQARSVGNLYHIRTCSNQPANAALRFVLPAGLDMRQAGQLDVYTWDAARSAWRWLGGEMEGASRTILLRVSSVPNSVLLMQTSSGREIANMEVLPESKISTDFVVAADRLSVVGMYLGDEGSISGDRSRLYDSPEAAGKRVISVRNWNLRGDVNRTLLRNLLASEESRRLHCNTLVNLVTVGGSPGLELDYRGIGQDAADVYAQWVQSLARDLRASGRWLSVGIPSPVQNGSNWTVPGYDLDVISSAADEIKVDLATNPLLQNGDKLESMFAWLTSRVPRSKVVAVLPMSSLSVAPNGDVAHISLAEASQAFGNVEPVSKIEGPVAPGSKLTFRLRNRFQPQSLIFDENSQSYRYTYQDLRGILQTEWVNNSASLSRLLSRVNKVTLKGIAFRGLEPELEDSATRNILLETLRRTPLQQKSSPPRLTWFVTAPDTSVQSEAGRLQDNQFTWTVPQAPGKYYVGAQFSGAGMARARNGYEVIVDARSSAATDIQSSFVLTAVSSEEAGATENDPARDAKPDGQQRSPLDAARALGLPKPTIPAGVNEGSFELGGQVAGLASFDRARSAGMNWVRLIVRDFADPSAFISAAHTNNFKVLITAVGSRARIMEDEYQQMWVAHVAGMAAAGADAIEVWHEPNLAVEWPAGRISGENYTRLLARAYNAIKQRNPRSMVISAGLAPTGAFGGVCTQQGCDDSAFLSDMARSGASEYADCIGVHYTSGTVAPTQSSGAAAGAHYSWYYAPLREQYSSVFSVQRKLCFTSFGYLTSDGYGALPARYAWGQQNTLTAQAQWLAQAAQLSATSGKVRLMIVWNLDLNTWNMEHADVKAGYALVRPNGSCPACETLRAAMSSSQNTQK